MGGVLWIFGEKVAVGEGKFGAKKKFWGGCNFEKKVSIIGANDKNTLEDGVFSGGGAFWQIILDLNNI